MLSNKNILLAILLFFLCFATKAQCFINYTNETIRHSDTAYCNGYPGCSCEGDTAFFWIDCNGYKVKDSVVSWNIKRDSIYSYFKPGGICCDTFKGYYVDTTIYNKPEIYYIQGDSTGTDSSQFLYGITAIYYFNGVLDTLVAGAGIGTCKPKIDFISTSKLCSYNCYTFLDKSKKKPRHWKWYLYNTSNDIIYVDTLQNFFYCFKDTGFFYIKEIGWNSKGTDSIIKSIHILAAPVVNNDKHQTIQLFNTIQTELEACAIGEQYEWFPKENLSCTHCNLTTATVSADEKYYCVVSNTNGCADTCFYNVELPFYIFIPNAFSPNGDGVNDVFKVRGTNIEVQSCKIYNRFGNEIYNGNLAEGWDGKYKSEIVENGVYSYTMIYLNKKTNKVTRNNGMLTVIR